MAVLAFNGDVKAIESAVENLAVVLKEELAIAEPNLTLFVEFVENLQQYSQHKVLKR